MIPSELLPKRLEAKLYARELNLFKDIPRLMGQGARKRLKEITGQENPKIGRIVVR